MLGCSLQFSSAMTTDKHVEKDLNSHDFTKLNRAGQTVRLKDLMDKLVPLFQEAFGKETTERFNEKAKKGIRDFNHMILEDSILEKLRITLKTEYLDTVCELYYAYCVLGIEKEIEINKFVRPGKEEQTIFNIALMPVKGVSKRQMLDPRTTVYYQSQICPIDQLTPYGFFDLTFNIYFHTFSRLAEVIALEKNALFPNGKMQELKLPPRKKGINDERYGLILKHALSKEKETLTQEKSKKLRSLVSHYNLEKYYNFYVFDYNPASLDNYLEKEDIIPTFKNFSTQDKAISYENFNSLFLNTSNFIKVSLGSKKEYFRFILAERFLGKWIIENSEKIKSTLYQGSGKRVYSFTLSNYTIDTINIRRSIILDNPAHFLERRNTQEDTRSVDDMVKQIEGELSKKKKKKNKLPSSKSQSTPRDNEKKEPSTSSKKGSGPNQEESTSKAKTAHKKDTVSAKKNSKKTRRNRKLTHHPSKGISTIDLWEKQPNLQSIEEDSKPVTSDTPVQPLENKKSKNKKEEDIKKIPAAHLFSLGKETKETKENFGDKLQRKWKAFVKVSNKLGLGEIALNYSRFNFQPYHFQSFTSHFYMPEFARALQIVKYLKECAQTAEQEEIKILKQYEQIKSHQAKEASQIISRDKEKPFVFGQRDVMKKEEVISDLALTENNILMAQQGFQELSDIVNLATQSLSPTNPAIKSLSALEECGDHYLRNLHRSVAIKEQTERRIVKAKRRWPDQVVDIAQKIRESKNN